VIAWVNVVSVADTELRKGASHTNGLERSFLSCKPFVRKYGSSSKVGAGDEGAPFPTTHFTSGLEEKKSN